MYKFEDYTIQITPLTQDDGGGFLVTFPDLHGCMADGETMEEAIKEAKSAFNCWVEACIDWNKDIPAPRKEKRNSFIPQFPVADVL